jgi:hypothetical protein
MKLEPENPPGRATRKARAFACEIARLTSQGYNSEAIRKALATAGVHVSRATVRREMTRPPGPLAREPTPDPIASPAPVTVQPKPPVKPLDSISRRGKDVAETFFKDVIDNAFVQGRKSP